MTLPNLLVIGVPKSGTSSLFKWLTDHPSVAGSKVKQTHYFEDPGTHQYNPEKNYINKGVAGYHCYFPDSVGPEVKWIAEATPSYIYSQNALENLASLPVLPKLIIVVREPADQIYSLYRYFKNNWQYIDPKMDFYHFIKAVREGRESFNGNELLVNCLKYAEYHDYIEKWVKQYGRNRVYICHYEDMKTNPYHFMEGVCKFLDIDNNYYRSYVYTHENMTYEVRSHLLQRINVIIRALIPQGEFYRALRRVYRRFNTGVEQHESSSSDRSMQLCLQEEYRNYRSKIDKVTDCSDLADQGDQ